MKRHLITTMVFFSPALAASTPLPQALQPYTTSYEQYQQVLTVDFMGISTYITATTKGSFTITKSPAQSLRFAFPEEKLTGHTREMFLKMTSQVAVKCLSLPKSQEKPLYVWLSQRSPENATQKWTSSKITVTYANDQNGQWSLLFARTGNPGKSDWKNYCLY